MAITEVRIHPAIGIARIGSSDSDFFIGPEKRWERTPPADVNRLLGELQRMLGGSAS